MLLEIFIIQKGTSFLLVRRSFTKKEIQMDGSLFSGMISAISLFSNELQIGDIQFFETKDRRILIHPFEDIIAVGIVEEKREDAFVANSVKKVAAAFWDQFGQKLKKWNGDTVIFADFPKVVDDIVFEEFSHFYIEQNFPKHLISIVRDFQLKFEPRILHLLGQKVGEHRATDYDVDDDHDFSKKISNALRKELNLFSISYIKPQFEKPIQVAIELCPFCRGIHDPAFSCNFMTGFIKGFVNSSSQHHPYHIHETQCSAHGDPHCNFEIRRK